MISFTGRKKRIRTRVLESSEESGTRSSSSSEDGSESESEEETQPKSSSKKSKYTIPKYKKEEDWSFDQLENFRKIYPHLKNFDDSVLKKASLKDITTIGKQKVSNRKFLNQTMTANYENLLMAMLSLEGAIHKVMPWNFAFKTVYIFMVSVDFGESELSGKPYRLQFLSNFVDEAIRANARNWEEKKKFLSHQDLCVKWTSHLTKKGALLKASEPKARDRHDNPSGGNNKDRKKIPAWVCRAFNEGKCRAKTTGILQTGIQISF